MAVVTRKEFNIRSKVKSWLLRSNVSIINLQLEVGNSYRRFAISNKLRCESFVPATCSPPYGPILPPFLRSQLFGIRYSKLLRKQSYNTSSFFWKCGKPSSWHIRAWINQQDSFYTPTTHMNKAGQFTIWYESKDKRQAVPSEVERVNFIRNNENHKTLICVQKHIIMSQLYTK